MNNSAGSVTYEIKLTTEDIQNALNDTNNKMAKSGEKAVALGNLMSSAIEMGAKAILDLGKKSLQAMGDFEQLYGGVEAMFGGMEKGSEQINKVLKTSKNAWKDLTMSQNQYFQTFNSTYPLIKTSIDDENEAIDLTNRMLSLESDLANTFGYDMENAANAINWALKGTYSYIDNLNIGIKGTKEGFQEAAEKLGYMKEVDELTSAEILDILERTANEYGVLGRTGAEAAGTIQGSFKMVQAAWQDFLSGQGSVDNLIEAIGTAADNLIPAIITMLPNLIEGVTQLIIGLVERLPEIFQLIIQQLPILIKTIADTLPTLLPEIVNAIIEIIPIILENAPLFIEAGMYLLGALVAGLINAIPELVKGMGTIKKSFKDWFEKLPDDFVKCGKELIKGLWNGIHDKVDWVVEKIKGMGSKVINAAKKIFDIHSPSRIFKNAIGKQLMNGLAIGIDENTYNVIDSLEDMNDEIMQEMNKAVNLSMGEINANANVNSNFANNRSLVINAQFSGNVELDGEKTGRILTPVITQTIKNGGGI